MCKVKDAINEMKSNGNTNFSNKEILLYLWKRSDDLHAKIDSVVTCEECRKHRKDARTHIFGTLTIGLAILTIIVSIMNYLR